MKPVEFKHSVTDITFPGVSPMLSKFYIYSSTGLNTV